MPKSVQFSPSDTVRNFLQAMERRDLEEAKSFLSEKFSMTFPGGAKFTSLEDLIDWAKGRYSSVGKTYENFEEVSGSKSTSVYCYGTLHGVWLDGSNFEGIRFIDRFSVREGLLTDQLVWNDMGQV